MENIEDFQKIIDDFVKDLLVSYPEHEEIFSVINYDEYYEHCKEIFPQHFFNILYENDEIFETEEMFCLLPGIDFCVMFKDKSLSDKSKRTIWKYLQLILFCVCKDVDDKSQFGDANYLFEAISEEDLEKKIENTMEDMKKLFMNGSDDVSLNDVFSDNFVDISNNMENLFSQFSNTMNGDGDGSGNAFDSIFGNAMNEEDLKDHLHGIMGGKIGALAKEIAEEATNELGLDETNTQEDQSKLLQNLFKNPTKLLDIVKNIGGKLESKLKNGELKESELLEEAQEIMSKMKDMPGIKEMMSKMGMGQGSGKFDMNGMANKMNQNLKQAKMKERMQEKLKKNKEMKTTGDDELSKMENMTKISEDTFVWNDDNSDPKTSMKKSSKKKKKKKKKKN